MKNIMELKKYLTKHKKLAFKLAIFSTLYWIISIISPYISGLYIDLLVEFIDYSIFIKLIGSFVIINFLELIIVYCQNMVTINLQNEIAFEINFDVIEHMNKLPIQWFNNKNSSYLNQRINSDSNLLSSFIVSNLVNCILNLLTFCIVLFLLCRINFNISLMLIIFIPLYVVCYYSLKKPLYRSNFLYKEKQNEFFSIMNNQFSYIYLIKLNVWFEFFSGKFKKKFYEFIEVINKYAKISYLFNNIDLAITRLANTLIYTYGGYEVINNRLTIGEFTIIKTYFSIVLSSISYFLNLGKQYQQFLVSYTRIKQIFDTPIENNGEKMIDKVEKIELKNISFSYQNNKKIVSDFSYIFERGKVYSIIGKNGTGKSTLINMIMGLIKDFEGNILYNNIDINNIDLYYLRENLIGITEQEPMLINETIMQNLTLGLEYINQEEISGLCKIFMLDKFLLNLEDGINTIVNEHSSNLSGGEKQKISLIRALLKKPDVLILDEPTSAMDIVSLNQFKEILNNIKKDKIIIIITHDEKILDVVDEILKLSQVNN